MNRELKFRAWDKKRKTMIQPIYSGNRPEGVKKRDFFMGFNSNGLEVSEYEGKGYWRKFPVMQFSGLHDKNGREVYHGDIVTAWSEGVCGKFVVGWREDGGGTPCLLLYPAWQKGKAWKLAASKEEDGKVYDRGIEVIGNIYAVGGETMNRDAIINRIAQETGRSPGVVAKIAGYFWPVVEAAEILMGKVSELEAGDRICEAVLELTEINVSLTSLQDMEFVKENLTSESQQCNGCESYNWRTGCIKLSCDKSQNKE